MDKILRVGPEREIFHCVFPREPVRGHEGGSAMVASHDFAQVLDPDLDLATAGWASLDEKERVRHPSHLLRNWKSHSTQLMVVLSEL